MKAHDRIILEKMLLYCERIEANLSRFDFSKPVFISDVMFQDACSMCIVQIGELSAQLSDEIRKSNSNIPWRIIKDTRNYYVHDYGTLDLESVWATLNEDIPDLKTEIKAILER